MKIGFFQYNVVFKNPEANRKILYENLKDEKFDLIVLPELFTTGYLLGDVNIALELAEDISNSPTIKLLEEIAKNANGYIIGSMLEKDGNNLFNAAVVIGPMGYIGKQRKLNPTNYETIFSQPGDKVEIFTLNGIKIGIAICFDLWFSELCKYYFHNDVQILCHTANYGGIQSPAIAQSRAIENKMFVISCNRTGREVEGEIEADFRGESRVVDFNGNVLLQATQDKEVCFVEVEPGLAKDKHLEFSSDYKDRILKTNSIIDINRTRD